MKATFLVIFFIACLATCRAQTIGGSTVYSFLSLPGSPQLSALGGVNVSNISNDVSASFNNPSLLRPSMHLQLATVFNAMYAGIKNYQAAMGYHSSKLATSFSLGVQYLNYGSIAQTDAAGNLLGSFRPGDYVVQVSASRQYLEKWHYGATLKLVNSNYGLYRSTGLALDAGVSYYDSAARVQVSLVMKNMGLQLKKYMGTAGDDMPFDMQLGISKRLQNAPIQFSITAHQLHRFDIRYNDTIFNRENGSGQAGKAAMTLDNVFRHFVLATQFYVGDKLEITAGYNHLRRSELDIYNSSNGLNGFSLGAGVLFRKLQLRYARSYYQNNTAYNQFGINMSFNDFQEL